MAASFFHSFLRGGRASQRPPNEDINKALTRHMEIPPAEPGSDRIPVISDAAFRSIANLLALLSNPMLEKHGKLRPRIYTILHHINRTDVFPSFVESDFTDFMLPIPPEELPLSLGHDKSRFLQIQHHCLTATADMFKGEGGRHVTLETTQGVLISMEVIGSGAFGHVDKVWSTLTLGFYARKRFPRGNTARETKAKFEYFEREIGALKKLRHKHLVRIRGTYTDARCFGFLMDPVADCDLEVYLDKIKAERVPTLRSFFGCLASALKYLHSQKIHHMDIKPRNILIKGTFLYLADFGAAHDWSARDRSTTWSPQPRTTFYLPPERELDPHARVNYSSDIWSLGVVYLEMLTVLRDVRTKDFREHLMKKGTQHQYPYKNITGVNFWLEYLRRRPGPEYDNIPQTWVKEMLMKDPTRRPYAKQLRSEILQAGYFSGFCCSVLEQEDDLDEIVEPEEDLHNIDYWNPANEPDSEITPNPMPMDSSKSQSIQSWINRTELTEVIGSDRVTDTREAHTINFEIDEDDEGTIIPLATTHDDTKPILQELSSFDFLAGFGTHDSHPTSHGIEFGIDQDGSDTTASEITLELGESTSGPDMNATPCYIGNGNYSRDLAAQLAAIEEKSVLDEVEELDKPLPLEDDRQEPSARFITLGPSIDQISFDQQAVPDESLGFGPGLDISPALESPDNTQSKVDEAEQQLVEDDTFEDSFEYHVTIVEPVVEIPVPYETNPIEEAGALKQQESSKNQSKKIPRALRASLTRANLDSLSSGTTLPKQDTLQPKQHQRRQKMWRVSPRKYIQKVSVETDSEATSVMSEGARRNIQRLGISVWMSKSTPMLRDYVTRGKIAAVRALLEAGCKPYGKGPLLAAISGKSMNHVKCADALLKKGANVNIKSSTSGKSALSMAIEHQYYHGYKLLILTLLKYGADPNVKDKNGDSPILQILYGHDPLEDHRRDALALMFANSSFPVDVNVMPLGTLNTPLHLAVRRKDPYATGMLLENGANIAVRNGAGQTAFALAVSGWSPKMTSGQSEVARLLVKAGADVNELLGPSKSPALHTAIGYGLVDVVHMLTKARANLILANDKGQTAFQVCTNALAQGKINDETAEQITSLLMAYDQSGPTSDTDSSSSGISIDTNTFAVRKSNEEIAQMMSSWLDN